MGDTPYTVDVVANSHGRMKQVFEALKQMDPDGTDLLIAIGHGGFDDVNGGLFGGSSAIKADGKISYHIAPDGLNGKEFLAALEANGIHPAGTALFMGCGTEQISQTLTLNTSLTAVGTNGETALKDEQRAALMFASVFARTGGNLQAAVMAANAVIKTPIVRPPKPPVIPMITLPHITF